MFRAYPEIEPEQVSDEMDLESISGLILTQLIIIRLTTRSVVE